MHSAKAPCFVIGLLLTLASCANPQVDGSMQTQTFDVSASGTPSCPGTLYDSASSNLALCSHAPEMCQQSTGASTIICSCVAEDAGTTGHWACYPGPDTIGNGDGG